MRPYSEGKMSSGATKAISPRRKGLKVIAWWDEWTNSVALNLNSATHALGGVSSVMRTFVCRGVRERQSCQVTVSHKPH